MLKKFVTATRAKLMHTKDAQREEKFPMRKNPTFLNKGRVTFQGSMASHLTNDSRDIITRGEFMNLLIRPHHIPNISIQLTAKPVENSEQW